MTSKAERNARAGRLYYNALTDAAGYPNGMPYWAELPPSEKYYLSMIALSFLEYVQAEGFIKVTADIGAMGEFGKGDCDALMQHFEKTLAADRAALDRRIESLRAVSGVETSSITPPSTENGR